MDIFLNWFDLVWVPVALLVVNKGQKLKAVLFVLACALALRLQVELMVEINYPSGFLPLLDYPLLHRGFIIYGVFTAVFLALSFFSREKDHYIYIAAAIAVFTIAFCVSSFVMVL